MQNRKKDQQGSKNVSNQQWPKKKIADEKM